MEQTSATMVAATMATRRSRRCCASPPVSMISRSLRRRMREPPILAGATIAYLKQPPCRRSVSDRVQTISRVQRAHSKFGIGRIDQYRDFDLGGGDRLDIDALLRKCGEHGARHAHLALHADAYDRHFGHIAANVNLLDADP